MRHYRKAYRHVNQPDREKIIESINERQTTKQNGQRKVHEDVGAGWVEDRFS